MRLSNFIALRLYKSKTQKGTKPIIGLGVGSIALSVAVMIISIGVLLGFKQEITNKLIGFNAPITILPYQYDRQNERAPLTFSDSLKIQLQSFKEISHLQTSSQILGLIKTESDNYGFLAKGIGNDYDTSFLHKSLIEGRLPLINSESPKEVVISQTIAQKLNLKLGDKLRCYFTNESKLKERAFYICGIYQTHLQNIDKDIIILSQTHVQNLLEWDTNQVSLIEIQLDKNQDINNFATLLNEELPYEFIAYSTYELFPGIFDWLALTDMNVLILFIIMSIVSSISLISILFILMIENTSTIGLLSAMGATQGFIRSVFIKHTTLYLLKGLIIGNLIGLGTCLLQYYFQIITLDPQTYFLTHIPIKFDLNALLGVNLACIFVALLAITIPSRFMRKNPTIQAIKGEV